MWSYCSDIQHMMALGLSQRVKLALEALLISAVQAAMACHGVKQAFKSNYVKIV